jgi:hypothetical protein
MRKYIEWREACLSGHGWAICDADEKTGTGKLDNLPLITQLLSAEFRSEMETKITSFIDSLSTILYSTLF